MNIKNKQAYFDYALTEHLEAGIVLTGAEVKSLREGHAQLDGSYVRLLSGEAYLVGAQIFPFQYARPDGYDPARSRKLLLSKKELVYLKSRMDGANLTVVPVRWYTKGPRIKLEIALAKGKKQFEKRETKRKQDQKRELEREFRGKIK